MGINSKSLTGIDERIKLSIAITDHALRNNISLKKASKYHDRYDDYVSDVMRDCRKFGGYDKQLFETLKKQYEKFHSPLARKARLENSKNIIESELSNITLKNEVIWDEKKNEASVELKLANAPVNNLEDALKYSKVDLNVWEVERHVYNTWTTSAKNSSGNGFIQITNVQVKVWFSRRKLATAGFQEFIKKISQYSPDYSKFQKEIGSYKSSKKKRYSYEVSAFDLHIGKLAWEDEVGEDYDTKIAIKRYNETIDNLIRKVEHVKDEIEEIIFPIGNDLLNIDNKNNTTTAGTPQSVDSRWQQMFIKTKDMLVNAIDKLSMIAPVKVVIVWGNHDTTVTYYLGHVLEAWYRTSNIVSIDNQPTQRKYHVYGVNLIGYTHGNEEKHQDLGLIMATERPELWSSTKYREIHLGHFHSRRSTKYVDVNEFQGFIIRILPSLSGTDSWHYSKGYMSVKAAVGFLYDKDNGLVSEHSHNVFK